MKGFLDSLRPHLRLIWMGVAIVALVSGMGGAANHSVSAQPPANTYMYAVKIVCVPELGPADPALVPAIYRTAVNVHNPWPQAARIVKWVTLSPPQGEPAIIGEQRHTETLEPYQAFDVDCVHMATKFGLDGRQVPGGKGFLIIQSDQNLDVVGVYTSEELTGARVPRRATGVGLGLDIEYIQPKIAQVVSQNPDLTVSITADPGADCPSDSCTIHVEFVITNASTVDVVSSFDIFIEMTAVPSHLTKTLTVSGLAAGASQSFSETLPGFCFVSDCTAWVTVDSANVIAESDETNNMDTATTIG